MKIVQEYTFGSCRTGFHIYAEPTDKILSIVCEQDETLKVFVLKGGESENRRWFYILRSEEEVIANDPEKERLEYVTTYRVQRKEWPDPIFYHVFEVIEVEQVRKDIIQELINSGYFDCREIKYLSKLLQPEKP